MLRARSERRVSRGEPALDIDAEVARLLERRAAVRRARPERSSRRSASSSRRATNGACAQGKEALDVDAEVARTLEELERMTPSAPRPRVGYKRAMRNVRRFQLDELILRPGTYFNPQTEIMVVVDDSPEVDHEIFEAADVEPSDWVLISEETPDRRTPARRARSSASSSPTRPAASSATTTRWTTTTRTSTRTTRRRGRRGRRGLDGVDDLEFERE